MTVYNKFLIKVGNIMAKEPLVYVIMVNWNNYTDTINCLNSIFRLTYNKFKIIIVDNNSSDGSFEQLKNYCDEKNIISIDSQESSLNVEDVINKKLILIRNSINSGFAGGNNVGIKIAENLGAEYLWLLNNDTEIKENSLEELVKYANEFPRSIIGSKVMYFHNPKMIQTIGGTLDIRTFISGKSFGNNVMDNEEYNNYFEPDYINGASMFIPIHLFKEIGYFDENYFLYWEETDLCVRAKKIGWKMIYCHTAVIWHKEGSTTKKVSYLPLYYYTRNCLYFYKKNYPIKLYFILVMGYIFKNIKRLFSFDYKAIKCINKAYIDFLKGNFGRM